MPPLHPLAHPPAAWLHEVENLPLLPRPAAELCQPLITSSARLQPLPEHLHPHAARPWGCLGTLQVASGQDDTFFKEEIHPGEALGGASGYVSSPCVQCELPEMIQGEVWELIWVNRRSDPDCAAH